MLSTLWLYDKWNDIVCCHLVHPAQVVHESNSAIFKRSRKKYTVIKTVIFAQHWNVMVWNNAQCVLLIRYFPAPWAIWFHCVMVGMCSVW